MFLRARFLGEKELACLWDRLLGCVLLIELRIKQVPVNCACKTNGKQGVWWCRGPDCRMSVACREGNWVLCNSHLHFLVLIPVFSGASSEALKLLGDIAEGFGVLEPLCSPQFAHIFLLPPLQIVPVIFGTPLHGTRPALLRLTKPNSWSSYFVVFYDKWNAKFSILAFSHGPLTHVVAYSGNKTSLDAVPEFAVASDAPPKVRILHRGFVLQQRG